MNRKGFTLVELLAVIVLLTILGVYTVSTILEQTESNKNLIDSASEQIIKAAAQQYISLNSDNYEQKSGNIYCIDLDKVLGYLDIDDINAATKEKLSIAGAKVKITFINDNFDFIITSDCVSNVDKLPNAPNLKSNMIPIKWDSNNNIVKADETKPGDWYNYAEKKWANAIIVSQDYLSALKGLKPGDLILPFNQGIEDVIFAVWIPRFSYDLNISNVDVTFETDLESTRIVHPAFNNIEGFWVSKFELTYNNELSSTYSNTAYKNSKSNLETLIGDINTRTDYSFLTGESEVKMISNYEWAAISFLTNSKYGTNKEKVYAASDKTGILKKYEVSLNERNKKTINLTNATTIGTSDIYYSDDSVFSSSNRNVTGVYDLSGGVDEWIIDSESQIKVVYNTDAAALNRTLGRLGSATPSYDINSDLNYCLTRGGDIRNNGLFSYEFYPCDTYLTTRLVIK